MHTILENDNGNQCLFIYLFVMFITVYRLYFDNYYNDYHQISRHDKNLI